MILNLSDDTCAALRSCAADQLTACIVEEQRTQDVLVAAHDPNERYHALACLAAWEADRQRWERIWAELNDPTQD
jgi:hypothetical protein